MSILLRSNNQYFPTGLKNIRQPLSKIYYEGDIRLLTDNPRIIAIVGSRKCTEYRHKSYIAI